jgi:hypothetical protein
VTLTSFSSALAVEFSGGERARVNEKSEQRKRTRHLISQFLAGRKPLAAAAAESALSIAALSCANLSLIFFAYKR